MDNAVEDIFTDIFPVFKNFFAALVALWKVQFILDLRELCTNFLSSVHRQKICVMICRT